jgi:hypothetical protein
MSRSSSPSSTACRQEHQCRRRQRPSLRRTRRNFPAEFEMACYDALWRLLCLVFDRPSSRSSRGKVAARSSAQSSRSFSVGRSQRQQKASRTPSKKQSGK